MITPSGDRSLSKLGAGVAGAICGLCIWVALFLGLAEAGIIMLIGCLEPDPLRSGLQILFIWSSFPVLIGGGAWLCARLFGRRDESSP